MKKLFGELNITWPKLIIAAIILGVYTGIMAILPFTRDTSFADISISFEWWILFGIIIIINSKTPIDSALKCFVFFLISQPLVYLVQAPFHEMGLGLFVYYPPWFIWTLLTLPMGFIGYYLKKDKWWGLFILTPILLFLGFHYNGFLATMIATFPKRLLSTLFCLVTLIIYPLYIFKDKKNKIIGLIISILIIIAMTILTIINPGNSHFYSTEILVSSEEHYFDETYKVTIDNKSMGTLTIQYIDNLECYSIHADFDKAGKTTFTIESPTGEKQAYEIDVRNHTYDLKRIDVENTNES